ncbi:helicase-associated domain-containing protein [Virgisporangium ochraceum]|uniref:Helicase XPB/Ssl2 N-terminal domain-containing protein n=1 Tax=Virgisporangium ochraceum TaxID=65505 RepID=A0A8J3ZQB5_9ACTN|nr:helicase-associated domain-containing protein [Virgisporangium ochraceum]GIJ65600.1 hypothetical protein Voc01_005170 [Virgisporangium ochraceum]
MATLTDHLRGLSDERLAALVRLRPDLVVPVPGDLTALAVRAQSRLSVARALDSLDRFTLEVLDAVRFLPAPVSVEAVLAIASQCGAEPAVTRPALAALCDRALVYGPDHDLAVVPAVTEVSPYPAGLGRPAADLDPSAAALAADPAGLRRTLLSAPQPARAALDRLTDGPPLGVIVPPLAADSPIRWLLDHHLLVQINDDTVELPREVALLLRRDAGPLGRLHPVPPVVSPRRASGADRAGAGQALEVVRWAEAVLEALSAEPAAVLRAGGFGVRDLKRVARVAGVSEADAALLLEVAYAAGLLGDDDAGFLPTAAYDGWQVSPLAQRWRTLAAAWLTMPRSAALVGQRDDRDRPIAALSAEAERLGAPAGRRAVLDVLAGLPKNAAPKVDDVAEILAWQAPRRTTRSRAVPAETVLAEAATLGLTGLGALTGYARALLRELDGPLDSDDPLGVRGDRPVPDAAAALAALLPAPVDTVVLQGDLSVIVPGPAEPTLAAELALVADAESASMLRVTPASVRRALDTGYSASDLHTLFKRRSSTAVPQALTYLIDDVARKHGGLRAGTAGAYLRSEDEALVTEVHADKRLATLGFRRLASTVLVTPAAPGRLLDVLRAAGYAPVREDATGAAVLSRPRSRRAPGRPVPPARRDDPLAMPELRPAQLAGVVEQIRRGDAAARALRRAPESVRTAPGTGAAGNGAHATAMQVLQQALRDRSLVWVGYVDAHGSPTSRLVRPVSMAAGYLRAEDERTETLHTLALYRITAAELATST